MADEGLNETFRVSLSGNGINIEREVSADKVPMLIAILMNAEAAEGVATRTFSETTTSRAAKISLREFLDDSRAATKPDQIVTIGQYMFVHEAKETFSRDEIKNRFPTAREPLPANFPRDFNAAVAKGMIAEDQTKRGCYYVTRKGVQAVETQFGVKS